MNKKNIFAIIGVILIILIGIIVYIAMIKKTTSWQTYRNDKYGFELKYPNGWIAKQPLNGDTTIVYIFSDENAGEATHFIWIASHDELPSNFPGINVKYTEDKIGNYKAFKTSDLPSPMDVQSYFIEKENGGYIEISLTPLGEKYVNTFEQIISTFKFK